jgi:hypothetical protein
MAVGAGMKSGAAGSALDAKASGYDRAASTYDRQAALELEKAEFDVSRTRDNVKRVMGSQRAGYAAAGIASDGTPTTVAFDTLTEAEKDIYAIRWGAKVRADNYYAEASSARANASDARSAKGAATIAPWIDFAGSAFTMGAGGATGMAGNITKLGKGIFA